MPGEHSGGMIGQISSPPPPPTGHPSQRKKKPVYNKRSSGHPTQRKRTYTPKQAQPDLRSGGGGGGGGGGSYGGGGGSYLSSNGAGGVGLTSAAPPPGINDFLTGDDTYQGQLAALTKALANYQSQMGERTGEYNTDFARRISDLNLTEQRNTTDQADDYAGRGLYISGLYGKARGDLERDFDNREGDMNLAKSQFLSGLNRDFTNFQEENNLSKQRARQDALNRRSLEYML
jgi:hypothetical protein